MKVTARATDYRGRWPRQHWVRRWLWDWEVARVYFWWASVGITAEVALVVGYYLGRWSK